MHEMTARRLMLWLAVMAQPAATLASDKGLFLNFESYQRARFLCQEFVRGQDREIHWRSFAIPDPPEKVVAFYMRQHGKPARADKGDFTWHLHGDPDSILTVYPVAHNDHFPHCAEKPVRGERTVVLTSVARKL